MATIEPGTRVPDFSLPMTGGGTWSLKAAARQRLVIYFYARDMTSGCTREAGDFRDLQAAYAKAGVQVVGISRDSVASHDKFAARESLPFPLLSDADETVCRLFDVIKQKSLYGRKYIGVERSTFLLDGSGRLRQAWRMVKVAGHAEEVLEAARRL